MGQKETVVTNKNRIMIYGPKNDGTYIVEFRTADGEELAISVPRNETAVLKHFPGADAEWVVRTGRSVRNLRRAHVLPGRARRLIEADMGRAL
jgi:hypothetical protein